MKISIVTNSLNQGRFIAETLESVRTQNYPEVEHLVLDGQSTDGTLDLLKGTTINPVWRHVKWWSEADSGQSEAMNKGFRRATGEIIGWLNSDDRYCPGALDRVAKIFARNPNVDVVYGDYTFMEEDGTILTTRREIAFNLFTLLHHRVPYIPTTATFFRRRIFDEGNFLDESLHYAMDYEFFVRLATKGYRFQHLSAVLADFRLHSESKTCTRAFLQLDEKHAVTQNFSRVSRIKSNVVRRLAFTLLQKIASLMRYTEKLARGYYWNQHNPKSLNS
jgi:glycosyltransferase involved in cell wall biosynthesis